jgi:hypothetical protein
MTSYEVLILMFALISCRRRKLQIYHHNASIFLANCADDSRCQSIIAVQQSPHAIMHVIVSLLGKRVQNPWSSGNSGTVPLFTTKVRSKNLKLKGVKM